MTPNLANLTIHSSTTTNPMTKINLTDNQLKELRSFLVERMVDNMSTEDLVNYVMDDLDKYYDDLPDAEFIDEAQNYWEDGFDEVVKDIKDYTDCDFKRERRGV